MEKVRIGNDIEVKYTVLMDGLPETFVCASNISATIKNEAYSKVIPSTFSIVGNIVNIMAIARNQKLSDVFAPLMSDGDVLKWNGTTNRFEVYNLNNLIQRIETLENAI